MQSIFQSGASNLHLATQVAAAVAVVVAVVFFLKRMWIFAIIAIIAAALLFNAPTPGSSKSTLQDTKSPL